MLLMNRIPSNLIRLVVKRIYIYYLIRKIAHQDRFLQSQFNSLDLKSLILFEIISIRSLSDGHQLTKTLWLVLS